jgi:multicomponent K+:H+ antiporter subunit A
VLGVAIWALGIAGAIAATACRRQRFLALVFLGATGLMVSLAFVLMSAPDLALTQLLVEVVTVVMMMLVLHYLPQAAPPEGSRGAAWRDAAIAAAAGLGLAAIAWAVLTRPFDPISPYYLAHALTEGGGANAVNVIIVDFRGFDTLGEITVLGAAALIVFGLLGGLRAPAWFAPAAPGPWNPLLLQVIARTLLPLAVVVSVYFFLRGHNLPGGGFIGGLVFAAAWIVLRVAGVPLIRTRLPYATWIGGGLAIAVATGLGSIALGYPFLTSASGHPVLPILGELPLASAALFDLGVYVTVIAATLLLLRMPGLVLAPRPPAPAAEAP